MKIGTIGSGSIVEDFVTSARLVDGVSIEAVFSRTEERAKEFSKKIGVSQYYSDIDALFSDENISLQSSTL